MLIPSVAASHPAAGLILSIFRPSSVRRSRRSQSLQTQPQPTKPNAPNRTRHQTSIASQVYDQVFDHRQDVQLVMALPKYAQPLQHFEPLKK
jgi:hypothetical protein